MSVFESRIPAGGLLACAVAATLALPLVVAGGLPPEVGSAVGPDFGDLRVVAPDAVTPNLPLPGGDVTAVTGAAGSKAVSVAGRLVLLPGSRVTGRTRATFLDRLPAREGYGAVAGDLERDGEGGMTAERASGRERPNAPREAPTPRPPAKPAVPAAPATPAAPSVPSLPAADPSTPATKAAAPAPTATDEPVAVYRAPTTQKPKPVVETKKPPNEPKPQKAPERPKAAPEPKEAKAPAPPRDAQPKAPKDEPKAGKPHEPAPAPAAPAVASTETGTTPSGGPGKTKDPAKGKEKQPEAEKPAEAPAEPAAPKDDEAPKGKDNKERDDGGKADGKDK